MERGSYLWNLFSFSLFVYHVPKLDWDVNVIRISVFRTGKFPKFSAEGVKT